jgi:hypothetical protein
MTDAGPDDELVRIEPDSRHPDAVVLGRRTVALTVMSLIISIGGLVWLTVDARNTAAAAVAQSETNEEIIAEVNRQGLRTGTLVEQGTDCMIALQGEAVRNAEITARASAAAHDYPLPALPRAVNIPDETQRRFIEEACSRFFSAQEEGAAAQDAAEDEGAAEAAEERPPARGSLPSP